MKAALLVAAALMASAGPAAAQKPVRASSVSMEPTIERGDTFFVDEATYRTEKPRRGDIAVLRSPAGDGYFVYRIIALPGERLVYGADGRITLDGAAVAETRGDAFAHGDRFDQALFVEELPGARHAIYAPLPEVHAPPDVFPALVDEPACHVDAAQATCLVPADRYFLLGDNRYNAKDSRFIGFVPRENITARVLFTGKTALLTEDVDNFYQVYDSTHGHPTAAELQAKYLDPGSNALHQFVVARIDNAAKLADAVAKRPADYAQARSECLPALARTRDALPGVYARMADIYPPSTFPPVTFVIGRDNTSGTTARDGILIGLEKACQQRFMNADTGVLFTRLVAHELAHVQQPAAQVDAPPDATLLLQALLEGGAEFVTELTSGAPSYGHMATWTRGNECAIEQAFAKDMLGTDISHWLYNGFGTPDKPGDLGYWVGYRIAKAYHAQAADKKQAVADLLNVDATTAVALLRRSGWTPQAGC